MTSAPPESEAGGESQGSTPVFSSAVPLRVVLDTNVLVSLYVFADSRFAPFRAKIENGEWQAITNGVCLDEFRRVLGYSMFGLTAELQQVALAAYDAVASQPAASPQGSIARLPRCSDRDDQKFLELARDSRSDWLITADKALLRLARRERLRGLFRILAPDAAVAEIQKSRLD